ncbi:hypothetical protein LZ30DRAFT_777457 [Colletotrichum cereale]|nr:hypothetical protein LZ30DRAFT_777457 [Colletotrichum cereale]
MDEMAVDAATSQMALVNMEPHETRTISNETIPFSTLPIELFFEIFSHLVHDTRSWQHHLDYLSHDHLLALTQRVKIGYLRPLAFTCKTMQRKVAFFCSTHTYLAVLRLDAATQLVGLLRRLGERPKRALSIKRLYLGLPGHGPLQRRAHAVKDRTVSPAARSKLDRQLLEPVIEDVMVFLALLLTSRLKELQECAIASGPKVLAALAEKLQHIEPFFPKMTSLTLTGVHLTDMDESLALKSPTISRFLAMSPQLTGLCLDGVDMRWVEPVTGVEYISSIILRTIALDAPSLRLLLEACKRLRTFMCFAQSKSDCAAYMYQQLLKANDVVDALGHGANTLRTVCLNLGQRSAAEREEQQVLLSVGKFTNLQRIWIDSKTVYRISHFMRTLPDSLNKLHLAGSADGLASEMPYPAEVSGLKQLAVEPPVVKDTIDILQDAGIKILGVADPRPVLW